MPLELLPQLLGPLGTLVLALVLIGALLTEKVVPRGRLDEMRAQRDASLVDSRAQTTANERLADAVENLVSRNASLAASIDRLARTRKP